MSSEKGTPMSGRSSQVADSLRTAILSGDYPPGTALREIVLAEQHAVSRRTIREALLELSNEGLTVHRHNQGASVRQFDADAITDLYHVRRILESEGARACAIASHRQLHRVTEALQDISTAAAKGMTSAELAVADAAFHGSVIALAGSPSIDEFYRQIGRQMAFAITLLQQEDATHALDAGQVVAEHRMIHDAILTRDAFEAQRLILDHITHNERNLLRQLAHAAQPAQRPIGA